MQQQNRRLASKLSGQRSAERVRKCDGAIPGYATNKEAAFSRKKASVGTEACENISVLPYGSHISFLALSRHFFVMLFADPRMCQVGDLPQNEFFIWHK